MDKRCARRAFLAAVARLFSVVLGAGAGSLLYHSIGGKSPAWPIATAMAVVSFGLLWYIEYERERF